MKHKMTAILILLTALAVGAASPARAQAPVPTPKEFKSYLFQIVLLVAEREGPTSLEGLPENTHKAINDVRDFLPFKSYKLLDVSVIRTAGQGRGLLNGPNGEDYRVSFSFDERGSQLLVHSFSVWEQEKRPPAGETDDEKGSSSRGLISSSFSIVPGETIVVGTSKLDSSTSALVVLLTAAL